MATLAFRVEESHDRDGVVLWQLVGELDLAVGDQLLARLGPLLARGSRVRIDLSRLEFIDSRGMYALIRVVVLGRETGERLVEIDRNLSANVRDALELRRRHSHALAADPGSPWARPREPQPPDRARRSEKTA